MRRVSRNADDYSTQPFLSVAPRMRRVSRNTLMSGISHLFLPVAPRMRRVSRNHGILRLSIVYHSRASHEARE